MPRGENPPRESSHKNRPCNPRTRTRLEKASRCKSWPNKRQVESSIVGRPKSTSGLSFGISAKNNTGHRNYRRNLWFGGVFRGRLKISIPSVVFSNRRLCPIVQSEPLCEIFPACRISNPTPANSRAKNRTAILEYSKWIFQKKGYLKGPSKGILGNGPSKGPATDILHRDPLH